MADKWEWRAELTAAHMSQQDVGSFLGLTKSQMAHLVSKMVPGKGLTATDLDRERWERALDYIKLKQNSISRKLGRLQRKEV